MGPVGQQEDTCLLPILLTRRFSATHLLGERFDRRALRWAQVLTIPLAPAWREKEAPVSSESATARPSGTDAVSPAVGTARVKRGMAEMLKGGVIMDVVTPDQAKIAEDAGAVAVMALERVPADIRRDGGVARMSDPDMIDGIIDAVSIPVMAKARIGHFVEAQVLQALGVDSAGTGGKTG